MKYSDITKLKHLAQDKKSRSANPAIVRASTVFFKTMQELIKHEKLVKKDKKVDFYEYGRGGSQTTIALENFIAELEGAHRVFLTPTGFAAIALSIMSFCRPGDEIIVTDACYHPTRKITSELLKEFEVKTQFYNPDDFESLKEKVTEKTKMIFVENPGSSTFEFQDLSKIIQLAKKNNIITAIDNTWGTPLFFKPLKLGFDISISSATKYFSGHSDVMLGTVAVNKKIYSKVEFYNRLAGYRVSADDAYLVLRGLRTLDVRLERHQKNTKQIINFLRKEKKIKEVLYPYKKGTKNYKNWKKYYSGATGLLSVIIQSKSKNSVFKFVNSLKLFGIGQSWGGFESLALYQKIQRIYRKYIKKNHHIVRLHIGLEDPSELIADLKQALKKIK
ncbi:MAG: cystathionine beta-lyase [Pelagibacteraceae bacterium]|nr:cystathionine beta-lyase [Pelagibacteraceae bacterium]MBO6483121.1 cystathionine beta-lyase [Pelagibacteraceae bacterium]MBO6487404.1 cystathionine beta-lyase [Pelagibacteraceae bacterium]MBO6488628.1 cystathionine beta-lyase [Pelagibacteraceae bacterium]